MERNLVSRAHVLTSTDVLAALVTSPTGLAASEAAHRLTRFGPNQMKVQAPIGLGALLLAQLRSLMVLLLALAAVVALVLRDFPDAVAIAAVLAINTAVGFFTELRARRALAALIGLDVSRATVLRDGRVLDVDAHTVVPGDVIQLEAGQLVPADARVIASNDLQVNESALTGESLPVLKEVQALPQTAPLAERSNMLYKATMVVSGRATAAVIATGVDTEVGRIGGLVSSLPDEKTQLEQKLDLLGRRLALLALAAAVLVAVVGWLQGVHLGEVLETSIALAVAAVPEGLPAVATITLALGVHRMARRNAIVRRLPSVETLGSVTLICTDKTGTLTAGDVTATVLWLDGVEYNTESLAESPLVAQAILAGVLANRSHLHDHGEAQGDPTELALLKLGAASGVTRAQLQHDLPEMGEVPFSSERRWMASVHRTPTGELIGYAKGAASTLLDRCSLVHTRNGIVPLDPEQRKRVLTAEGDLAARGLRVLALARGPVTASTEANIRDFELIGLVGMIDPPAQGVPETIERFRHAGVRTVMITGDQHRTAQAIASRLGLLAPGDSVLDGSVLDGLDEPQLLERLAATPVFSRIAPEAKLRLVGAYQKQGEVVAMIGDGINDAAALRKADVGVAMGGRGSDVAKEAAAVVLQDDRFQTIAVAIEQGRVVFDNIRKFVFYLFSCNLAEVLVLLIASALVMPLPLLPLQILWLNLVTDTFPALALAVEPGEPDVMSRKPRDPEEAMLSMPFVRSIVWYAALITTATLAAYMLALNRPGASVDHARTMAFMTLGLAQALHLGTARSTGHVLGRHALSNPLAIGAVVLVILLQALTLYYPPLASTLDTVALSGRDWLLVALLASLPGTIGQVLRLMRREPIRKIPVDPDGPSANA